MEILEITGKFQGNFRNSINSNNNDTHIDPNPGSELGGNFRNYREISGRFQKDFTEISQPQSVIIIIINISTLTLDLKDVEISEKFQEFNPSE